MSAAACIDRENTSRLEMNGLNDQREMNNEAEIPSDIQPQLAATSSSSSATTATTGTAATAAAPITNEENGNHVNEIVKEKKSKYIPKKPKTGFKGVFKCGKKFKAQIQMHRVQHYLGLFDTEEEAARAYDSHARIVLGPRAKTNFNYDDKVPMHTAMLLSEEQISRHHGDERKYVEEKKDTAVLATESSCTDQKTNGKRKYVGIKMKRNELAKLSMNMMNGNSASAADKEAAQSLSTLATQAAEVAAASVMTNMRMTDASSSNSAGQSPGRSSDAKIEDHSLRDEAQRIRKRRRSTGDVAVPYGQHPYYDYPPPPYHYYHRSYASSRSHGFTPQPTYHGIPPHHWHYDDYHDQLYDRRRNYGPPHPYLPSERDYHRVPDYQNRRVALAENGNSHDRNPAAPADSQYSSAASSGSESSLRSRRISEQTQHNPPAYTMRSPRYTSIPITHGVSRPPDYRSYPEHIPRGYYPHYDRYDTHYPPHIRDYNQDGRRLAIYPPRMESSCPESIPPGHPAYSDVPAGYNSYVPTNADISEDDESAGDWRDQLYYWTGVLYYDKKLSQLVWKGAWVGSFTGKPRPDEFAASRNHFEYTSDKVKGDEVLDSNGNITPVSGFFKGYYMMDNGGAGDLDEYLDNEHYLDFQVSSQSLYDVVGKGDSDFGVFIVTGVFDADTKVLEMTRQYIPDDDDRCGMSISELKASMRVSTNT